MMPPNAPPSMPPNAPPGDAPPQPPVDRPVLRIPRKVACPVCATTFAPRNTQGRCPVCGEQVFQADEVANAVPVIGPSSKWLFQEGNWRLMAVATLVVYQLILFIVLWIHLAQIHAL
jgi:hypothetical protein